MPACDEKAEAFNSYFNSVNVDDDGTLPDFPRRAKASISIDAVQFSTDKIHKAIKKLKPKFPRDREGFLAYLKAADNCTSRSSLTAIQLIPIS